MTPDLAAKATAVPYANFGNPQGLNLYAYVENNPTTYVIGFRTLLDIIRLWLGPTIVSRLPATLGPSAEKGWAAGQEALQPRSSHALPGLETSRQVWAGVSETFLPATGKSRANGASCQRSEGGE